MELGRVCSSNQPEAQQGQSELIEEGKRLGNEIIAKLSESENIWRAVSEKQAILHSLYGDQIRVSDKFTRYNQLWINRDYSISENIATFHQFTEVDEQAQLLSQYLDEFETKLMRSAGIVKHLIREVKTYIGSLRKSMETVIGAICMDDLRKVEIPPLDWVQRYPDPEVEMLSEEWEHLRLDEQISVILLQLEQIVQGNETDDISLPQEGDLDFQEEIQE